MAKELTNNIEFAAARKASGLTLEEAAGCCGIVRQTYALREDNPADFRLGDLVSIYEKMNEPGRRLLREAVVSLFYLPDDLRLTQ